MATSKLAAFNDAERAMTLMSDADALMAFFTDLDADRAEDVISGLEAFEGDFPADGIVPGSATLLNLMPLLPERERGMLAIDTRLVVARVVLRMIRQLQSQSDVRQAVDAIMPSLNQLSSKLELVQLVGYVDGVGHKLVSESDAQELQNDFVNELTATDVEDLVNEWDLLRVLLSPKHFDSGDVVNVASNVSSAVHWAVLTAAQSPVRSQSMGSRHVTHKMRLAWDVLVQVYSSEQTIGDVYTRLMSEGPNSHQAELLALVKKYLDGWRPDNHDEDDD